MQHTTNASETPCRACRRPLLHAWDEGQLVRADAAGLDVVVAEVLRGAGRPVYALTRGRHLVRETAERAGTLRSVLSRHAVHVCRPGAPELAQGELFDAESVRAPVRRDGGLR